MWDKDDHFSRWVQGLCAVPLVAWVIFGSWWIAESQSTWSAAETGAAGSVIAAAYLAFRCLRYALTGSGNVNRDDF